MKKSKNTEQDVIDLSAIMATWPARLEALKEKTGKTQEDAAAESGISSGQLSQYLRGINTPTVGKFEDFENYLRRMGV